jgi:hypothetical protein
MGWSRILLVILPAAACSQPDPASSGSEPGGSNPPPTAPLPPPPPQLCHIELACETTIPDEPKVGCDLVLTLGTQRLYEGFSGVERRGRSSLAYPKANYAVELREVDGVTNRPVDFFGFGADEDWVLDGSWVDRSFMRNTLASDLFQAFSTAWYAPESAYCTLDLNGEPQGIYRLVERIKQGNARVPLAKDDGQGGSFVLQQDDGGSLRFELGLESRWDTVYPKTPGATQIRGIQSWLDRLDDALNARADGEDGVFGVLNRANVVDWLLLQEFSKNIDAYKLSVFITKDVNGLGQLVPWDFDLSFGQPSVENGSTALRASDEPSGWVAERTEFVRDIVAVPGLGAALSTRWRALRQGPLSASTITQQLDAYERVVTPATTNNFDIWPLGEVRFEQIYGPYRLYEVDSFAAEMSHLRTWIASRLTWMDEHIDDYVDGP